jgi:histidyl-tRNA synthetase
VSSTKPPSGTRDFLPDEIRRREYVTRVVRDVYEQYGFEPLETPAFENIETLLGKYGEEGNKLIFKILRRGEHEATGEADLALRYDLTVPLARVVAQYQNDLPRLFKRYQIQPVWRADRPGRGRFREFFQCDIDSMGSTSPVVEIELLSAVSDVLVRLGFDDFVIRLNHRRVLTALLTSFGIPAQQHEDALVALDKLDKIGLDGVAREFNERGIDAGSTDACHTFFARGKTGAGVGADWFPRIEQQIPTDDSTPELGQLIALCRQVGLTDRVRVDPSLARGLSYYTGAIMEIAVSDLAGSLGGGGRYDHLIGMFLGRDVPACGFSLGLERIVVVMAERGMFPASVEGGAVDVVVTMWNDGSRGDALALARELRRGGLRVDLYPDSDKLSRQFKYASLRRVPFAVIVGDDERAQGSVSVKDLRSGEQQTVPRGDVVRHLQARRS